MYFMHNNAYGTKWKNNNPHAICNELWIDGDQFQIEESITVMGPNKRRRH
jgi:hypothetical protein